MPDTKDKADYEGKCQYSKILESVGAGLLENNSMLCLVLDLPLLQFFFAFLGPVFVGAMMVDVVRRAIEKEHNHY